MRAAAFLGSPRSVAARHGIKRKGPWCRIWGIVPGAVLARCVRVSDRAGVICIREVGDRLKGLRGLAPQQVRQLGDVRLNSSRLVFAEQLVRKHSRRHLLKQS